MLFGGSWKSRLLLFLFFLPVNLGLFDVGRPRALRSTSRQPTMRKKANNDRKIVECRLNERLPSANVNFWSEMYRAGKKNDF